MIIAVLRHNGGERVGWIDESMPDTLIEASHSPNGHLMLASGVHDGLSGQWETLWLHPDWLLNRGGTLLNGLAFRITRSNPGLTTMESRQAPDPDPARPVHGQPRCGAWFGHTTDGRGCVLPAGHNLGKPDVPSSHQFDTTQENP